MAVVTGRFAPREDGVADYSARLVEALDARDDVEPVVVATDGAEPGTGARSVQRRGGARATARALAELAPDVVHVQWAPTAYARGTAVALLPALLRAPVVTTLHEYDGHVALPRLPAGVWPVLERTGLADRDTLLLGTRSAELVTTNTGHAVAVRRRLRREASVVPIGPNVRDSGLSREHARAQVAQRWDVPDGRPLLVFFGFVHPVKGVRYLLDALARLRQGPRPLEPVLVVAGGSTSLALPAAEAAAVLAELQAHATALGVAEAVRWTGHRPEAEVSALLRAADLVVLPMTAGVTLKSGALLAALAHGACVAATEPPAPVDCSPGLVDGRTVLRIARVRDGDAVADAVRRGLADEPLRHRVAAGGQALVATNTWDRIAADHAEVYARVRHR